MSHYLTLLRKAGKPGKAKIMQHYVFANRFERVRCEYIPTVAARSAPAIPTFPLRGRCKLSTPRPALSVVSRARAALRANDRAPCGARAGGEYSRPAARCALEIFARCDAQQRASRGTP